VSGPYDYLLFQGGSGGAAADANNWYLRSTLDCTLDPGASACNNDNGGGDDHYYRPEAPDYSEVPLLAREMGLLALGTFHERKGDEFLHDEGVGAVWVRLVGEGLNQKSGGPLAPSFGGTIGLAQVGSDLYVSNDHEDFAGLFGSYARANGDVHGIVDGRNNALAGTLPTDAYSVGGTYTHIGRDQSGQAQWYVDAVVTGNWALSTPQSVRGVSATIRGSGMDASLEGGYNFRLDEEWTFEPMAQVVYSTMDFGNTADAYSKLSFHTGTAWYGRAGARLEDSAVWFGSPVTPFLEVNLWHGARGTDTVTYDGTTPVATPFGNTNIETALGLNAKLTGGASLYARVSSTSSIAGTTQQSYKGQIGFKLSW
jgi:outer membrane autotransporter protein